jgi:hypothetical protein
VSWQPIDLTDDAYAVESEPPKTCGLLYLGKRHAISGPPESTKTLLAAILGLEHMRAGHGKFALADFEMDATTFRTLLEDLGASRDEIGRVFYVNPSGPPEQSDLEALADAGVTLVFIDAAAGAYVASQLDDNKRTDVELFALSWVDPLWRRGITTALIDHVTKNIEGRGRYAIGSERKLGAVDVHLGLEVIKQLHRGANGLIRVHTNKDRPGHLSRPYAAEIELQSDPDSHRIKWAVSPSSRGDSNSPDGGDTFRPTVLMERVSAHLERQTAPVRRSEIARDVTGKRAYVLKAIDVLIAEGHAAPDTDGRITHISRFPVPDTVPDGSRNQDGGRFPGSLPLQGGTGTGTGTTHGTTNGSNGSPPDDTELERLANLGQQLGL